MQNKTFRLFISSTFRDFKKERNVLHTQVFPEIECYCQKKDFVFQPIDLRWGVSNEAQLDQKTLELCLEEVRVCKHFPHPNFLIMAGDRYGYIPLPYMIGKDEFEKIRNLVKIVDDLELLNFWYKLDENQIPASYILQPRKDYTQDSEVTDKFKKDFITLDAPDNKEKKEFNAAWSEHENSLRTIFQNAANEIYKDKNDKEYQKYFTSATEAEVIEGICAYKEKTPSQTQNGCDGQIDKEYILGYLRTIKNPKGDYVDGAVDKAKEFKSGLTYTLKEENIKADTFKSVEEYEKNSLEEFKNFLVKKLKKAIDAQGEKTETFSILKQEILEQNMFKEEKLKGFQGRETTLKIIQKYIEENTDTTQPLVIHGASGMGKSSLMAKVISDANSEDKNLIYRFVGATANSTTIRSTLISLCDELHQNGIIENIAEYEVKEHKFYTQINEALSSISEHTVIFIDALDQLTSKDNLEWLPVKLPNSLKIVLSVLNDAKYVEDTHCYNILKIKYPQAQYVNIEEDSLKPHKELLIEELLEAENRKLDDTQKEYLLQQWEKTSYSPLYLKIAIEEVKHWRAGDKEQKLANGVEGIIKEYIENLSRIYHHDKIVVEKVFGYINSSKDGLSEKELLDILSEDLEDEEEFQNAIKNEWYTLLIKKQNPRRGKKEELVLPLSIWSRLHAQLKPFIVERNIDDQPLMKFFHRQFTTVVDEYIKDKKEGLHLKLAQYFDSIQRLDSFNSRIISELPYQTVYSHDVSLLKLYFYSTDFLEQIFNYEKSSFFYELLLLCEEKNLDIENIKLLISFFSKYNFSLINKNIVHQYARYFEYDLGLSSFFNFESKNDKVFLQPIKKRKNSLIMKIPINKSIKYKKLENQIYLTNESGLLTILDLSTFKKEIRQLSNTELTVYTVDKENNLYLIDKNNYLICFNLDTNTITRRVHNSLFNFDNIKKLFIDAEKIIFVDANGSFAYDLQHNKLNTRSYLEVLKSKQSYSGSYQIYRPISYGKELDYYEIAQTLNPNNVICSLSLDEFNKYGFSLDFLKEFDVSSDEKYLVLSLYGDIGREKPYLAILYSITEHKVISKIEIGNYARFSSNGTSIYSYIQNRGIVRTSLNNVTCIFEAKSKSLMDLIDFDVDGTDDLIILKYENSIDIFPIDSNVDMDNKFSIDSYDDYLPKVNITNSNKYLLVYNKDAINVVDIESLESHKLEYRKTEYMKLSNIKLSFQDDIVMLVYIHEDFSDSFDFFENKDKKVLIDIVDINSKTVLKSMDLSSQSKEYDQYQKLFDYQWIFENNEIIYHENSLQEAIIDIQGYETYIDNNEEFVYKKHPYVIAKTQSNYVSIYKIYEKSKESKGLK